MSIATGISRVTGLIRNWAMAYAIGVTLFSSSYIVSNNIPNMIYELVAGGVLSSVFIPIFIERIREKGEEDAHRLASTALNVVLIALGVVALVATVFPQPFVFTQAFTLSPPERVYAVFLFRFFAVQIVFYGATAIFTGILNSHRHFIAPAAGPISNNIVVIATMLAYPTVAHTGGPVYAAVLLGVGTTLGVVAQMSTCIPALVAVGWRWQLSIDWRDPALLTLGRKMGPVLVYVITNLAGVSFRNAIAFAAHTRTVGQGPAAIQYAWMFYQLPYGVFAVALATAIFPELSELATRRDVPGFKRQFTRGLRANAALVIPAAAMLAALAMPLCRVYVLGKGAFKLQDVPLVANVLVVWALGLFSFAAYMYTVKAFYANQDTRTPMLTNIGATTVQVLLYWLLTVGFLGWPGIGLLGIPAGDAISYTLHLCVLLVILRSRFGAFDLRATLWTVVRMAVAALAGGLVAWGIVLLTPSLSRSTGGFVLQVAAGGSAGLVLTYALAHLFRVSEVSMATSMVRRVIGKIVPWDAA
jgi:putative peptidoglycan lipid II flippase